MLLVHYMIQLQELSIGIPIGAEAFIEAYTGRTRQGSPIWSEGMTDTEIFDRAMAHFFKTIEPGIISSGRKLFYALRGDVSGVGQPTRGGMNYLN